MSKIILLDAGPLGLVTNPRATKESNECNRWMQARLTNGDWVMVPAISDYEVRRELLRAGKSAGIARLDSLNSVVGYVPLTTEIMFQAASFWAQARNMGRPTAADAAIDGDVILAAQAEALSSAGHEVIIATTNVKHLELFVDARLWRDIN
jgi:predicted nucleic acid-binding protein